MARRFHSSDPVRDVNSWSSPVTLNSFLHKLFLKQETEFFCFHVRKWKGKIGIVLLSMSRNGAREKWERENLVFLLFVRIEGKLRKIGMRWDNFNSIWLGQCRELFLISKSSIKLSSVFLFVTLLRIVFENFFYNWRKTRRFSSFFDLKFKF